jgi:hypothetical protein
VLDDSTEVCRIIKYKRESPTVQGSRKANTEREWRDPLLAEVIRAVTGAQLTSDLAFKHGVPGPIRRRL